MKPPRLRRLKYERRLYAPNACPACRIFNRFLQTHTLFLPADRDEPRCAAGVIQQIPRWNVGCMWPLRHAAIAAAVELARFPDRDFDASEALSG